MFIRCENRFINFNLDNDGLEYTIDIWGDDNLYLAMNIFIIRQYKEKETLYKLTIKSKRTKDELNKNKITLENRCENIIQRIIDKWKEDKYQTISIEKIVE